ncbi:OmpA family protein [Algoriphagus sp. NG3]|uniref:OmpA family protein n=1 Tax=Algoriphagus sp. NG3 TaxID=3097546 RepID=UPI002A8176F5|nr:OmpA family protein [Algoriphagus sp. NG3]WPR77762.1 OmpA family protein [Algoriphagus sp. NG3]
MKNNLSLILILFLIIGFPYNGKAQNSLLRYADQQMELGNFLHAADVYGKAYERKETYRAAKGAALCYDKLNDYSQAMEWWEKTIAFEELSVNDAEHYLKTSYAVGSQNESRAVLGELGFKVEDFSSPDMEMILASHSGSNTQEMEYVNDINSASAADFMGMKDDEGNLYFVSDRGSAVEGGSIPGIRFDVKNKLFNKKHYDWTGREYLKVYRKNKTGIVEEIKFDREDFLHISDPSIVKVGEKEVIFFSATRDIAKVKGEKSFTVHPEVFYGTLNDGAVTEIKTFPYNDVFAHSVITPFADLSSGRLYFASDMEDGFGGFDIYYSSFTQELDFSSPVNVGDEVNSVGNERDPFLHDGKLYFASDGLEGYGGFDIFSADRGSDGKFENIFHLDAPVNSAKDDFAYRQFPDNEIYVSSNRLGDSGLDNIYRMEREYRQLLVRIIDCRGDLVSGSELNLADSEGDNVGMKQEEPGIYLGDLTADTDYSLSLAKEGFFLVEDKEITTKGTPSGVQERQYTLIKIPKDLSVFTYTIYYDLDKSAIRTGADEILSAVFELMEKHEFLELKVSAHTDSRASDKYNQALSRRRAEEVLSDLESKGISGNRIALEWFGEERLVTDCPDGVNCSEDKHQLNRRSELLLSIELKEGTVLPEEFLKENWCNETEVLSIILDEVYKSAVYLDKYDPVLNWSGIAVDQDNRATQIKEK